MKKKLFFPLIASLAMLACNNEASDSVEKAESINKEKMDTTNTTSNTPGIIQTDEPTTEFLVKAADGGMAEVAAGRMASEKASNEGVKKFATMMINDHSGVNDKVKALAAARNVTLPTSPSGEHQKAATKVGEKTGKDFDKDYMDMMVKGHEKTIDLFEKAEKDTRDEEVRTFITSTLPKIKMHLESAKEIRKGIK